MCQQKTEVYSCDHTHMYHTFSLCDGRTTHPEDPEKEVTCSYVSKRLIAYKNYQCGWSGWGCRGGKSKKANPPSSGESAGAWPTETDLKSALGDMAVTRPGEEQTLEEMTLTEKDSVGAGTWSHGDMTGWGEDPEGEPVGGMADTAGQNNAEV